MIKCQIILINFVLYIGLIKLSNRLSTNLTLKKRQWVYTVFNRDKRLKLCFKRSERASYQYVYSNFR